MKLSLTDAATILGRSPRQVRYMIRAGKLAATKNGSRWEIESDELPLTTGQREALAHRVEVAHEAFTRAIAPAEMSKGSKDRRRPYTVTDLDVFQVGREILEAISQMSTARDRLYVALDGIARGVHSYHPPDKVKRLQEARDAAASAVTALLVEGDHPELAGRLESEMLPRLSKLIAAHERRASRARFERFGSSR